MKYLVYILLLALPVFGWGQVVAVQTLGSASSVVYLCLGTPLKVAAESCPASELRVTTNNGIVNANELKKGRYSIIPERVGYATIYIWRTNSNGLKLLDSTRFRVKRLPAGPVMLSSRPGGPIPAPVLRAQIAPFLPAGYNMNIDGRYIVVSFSVMVKRNNVEIFYRQMQDESGTRIDGITHNFFNRLRKDDSVIFDEFKYRDCDETIVSLGQSMRFIIAEK
jgi:hypothetical protein